MLTTPFFISSMLKRLRRTGLGLVTLLSISGVMSLTAAAVPNEVTKIPSGVTLLAIAAMPSGFTDALVTSVDKLTGLTFTPDDRLLITSQPGRLYIYQNGALLPTPAIDLTSVVCSNYERGLLSVAVDPNFATNHFIYLFYTFNKYGVCSTDTPATDPVNRVSRFTLPASNIILPTTEAALLDNIPSTGGYHNAGDMHFGADGLLYISTGDSARSSRAQSKTLLAGKILRIESDGDIPPGNPFVGDAGSWRCGDPTGSSSGPGPCREIFAFGLRNPFRFAFRPGTNQFFINDVGLDSWEEINEAQIDVNYGWPCRERAHIHNTTGVCDPPPTNMIDPIFEYQHGVPITGTTSPPSCASPTGGAFVPNGLWPGYDGAYLWSDYVCGGIFRLTPSGGAGYTASDFATGINGPVHMVFGPYNSTQALYYAARSDDQVRRIAFSQAPTAVISANPISGPIPLLVTFNATGSSDPDGNPITFDWNFGDGVVLTGTTAATTTHTYGLADVYTATLIVRDNFGLASDLASQRIYPGNDPPVPTITLPLNGDQFAVGQPITLVGSAVDTQDLMSAIRLSWNVLLHHVDQFNPLGEHTHPLFSTLSVTSTNGTITNTATMPAPEGFRATALSYVEIQLIAADSYGLSSIVTQTVQPKRVNVAFATQPNGLHLILNNNVITATYPAISWEGYNLNVSAPTPQTDGLGAQWFFGSWSDGGAAAHTIVTPASATTYTATFQSFFVMWLPTILK